MWEEYILLQGYYQFSISVKIWFNVLGYPFSDFKAFGLERLSAVKHFLNLKGLQFTNKDRLTFCLSTQVV